MKQPLITLVPRASSGPPGYGHTLNLDPAHTAVVVVDVQRYFVEALPFMAMGRVVEPIARFLPIARASGMTVAFVRSAFEADMKDAGRRGSRTRQMMDSVSVGLVEGTPTAEIVADLAPHPGDIVVVKKRFSGFSNTEVDNLLKARGIETLVFAGGTTTVCIESTLRDAMFLEYNCVLLADCTADLSDALHESAIARIDMFFGWVSTSPELAAALTGSATAASVG